MASIGFTKNATAKAGSTIPEIGVGMLGYAFMGTAHSNAFKKIPYMIYPPAAIPKLIMVAGRNEAGVRAAAERFGYESYATDWRKLVKDDRVQLFDNGGPNDAHAAPCIAAARAGKHILCEKPLARNAKEAARMLNAVVKAGVVHAVAFNYRFVPAVRLIRNLITSGKLGQIYHFRAAYRQEWTMPHYGVPMNWRLRKRQSGSGALGDIGAHIIDLARYLVGEPRRIFGGTQTFIKRRPVAGTDRFGRVDVDDAFGSVVEFENGALGTIEATRFVPSQGYNRIKSMVEQRPDWCVSRQRAWGVPIPVFYGKESGEVYATPESFKKIEELALSSADGIDRWFDTPTEQLLPAGAKHPVTGETEFVHEKDILDVFKITKLDKVLTLCPDLDAALAKF